MFARSQQWFCSKWKKILKIILSSMKIAHNIPLDTPNVVFITTAELFCPELKFFLPKVQALLEKRFFFQKVYLELIPWRRRLWFWKHFCYFLTNIPKVFTRETRKLRYHQFCKKTFAKCFPGHVNWCFENYALIVFAKSPEKFHPSYEIFWETIIFSRVFFKMFSWTRRMWILKPCFEFFCSKSEKFFLKIQKVLKIYQFSKRFSKNDSLDT